MRFLKDSLTKSKHFENVSDQYIALMNLVIKVSLLRRRAPGVRSIRFLKDSLNKSKPFEEESSRSQINPFP